MLTHANTRVVLVGTTATAVVPSNPNRIGFILENKGNNIVHVSFGEDPSLSNGIQLIRGTGRLELWEYRCGTAVKDEMRAISEGLSSSVSVTEFVLTP